MASLYGRGSPTPEGENEKDNEKENDAESFAWAS
jgi:hypothetical protein